MNDFADDVKKRTNGALVVKVFPASQLYNDQDALAALGTGAVHMVWPVAVRLETIDPRTGIINLPFVLSDDLMENKCFNDGITKLMSSYVEPRKLAVLGFLRTSDLMFTFKDRDVQKLEDLKGAKIRVTGGKVFLDMMQEHQREPRLDGRLRDEHGAVAGRDRRRVHLARGLGGDDRHHGEARVVRARACRSPPMRSSSTSRGSTGCRPSSARR